MHDPLDIRSHQTLEQRAHRLREQGVEYKLRVIPGSGGQLELVEQAPKRSWLHEWARIMQLSGWSL